MRGLRENLFEHYDFEALYPSIWMHLYSWYSADTQIARYLKVDALAQNDLPGAGDSQTLKQALSTDAMGLQSGKKMELDLYPVNITDKMFKNKIMFNEASGT